MTVTKSTPEVIAATATAPVQSAEQEFDWRQCWYPVTFLRDFPKDRPYSFSLYDEPLVLWRNSEGQLVCLQDLCPHRAAKLSDGQIIDGKIECLYHGWQFGADGECLHIPQLPADAKIPANACVKSFKVVEKQGIVWMWAGEPISADEQHIPTITALDKPEIFSTDIVIDLPYDQSYLIEHVIDVAHIHISHDGMRGGGKREYAKPLEFEELSNSVRGIRGKYRSTRIPNQSWRIVEFISPSLVLFTLENQAGSLNSGLALHCVPLGKGYCRLLYRRYNNLRSWKQNLRPHWLEHWNLNKILEQDLDVFIGQEAEIERLQKSLAQLWLPLATSDALVLEYRKWLDKYGQYLPYYQGYSTAKPPVRRDKFSGQKILETRLDRHTVICSSCSRAYRTTIRVKQSLVGVAIALTAVAIITEGWASKVAVSGAILAVILAVVAQKVKTKFERSYTRH